MSRKMLCGLLVLILALTSAWAIAEQSSPALSSPTIPVTIPSDNNVSENKTPEGLVIEMSVIDGTPAEKLFEDIQNAVQNQSILEYLGQGAIESAGKRLEGKDTDSFILAELWTIHAFTNQKLPLIAERSYLFPVEYPEETPLVGFVGILGGENVDWIAVTTKGTDNGKVRITFSRETLQQIMDSENAVFILLQGKV